MAPPKTTNGQTVWDTPHPPTAPTPEHWSKPMVPTRKHGPPSVIHVSFMRMASLSMARAYDILDLRAYHGLDIPVTKEGQKIWEHFERAAKASYPDPGTPAPPPLTTADWNVIFGEYDVLTDTAALWADKLVDAYPNAKVVVVQRNFDSWWPSFEGWCAEANVASPRTKKFIMGTIRLVTGWAPRSFATMNRMMCGTFDAKNMDELRANSRKAYDAYYERIRSKVPPERRLEYRIGDGWEPLCAFLGKEVPNVPFPRVNDRAEHDARVKANLGLMLAIMWESMRTRLWAAGAIAVAGVGFWLFRKQGGSLK